MGKGVISILQGRISGARWAAGQVKSSVQQGRASSGRCQGRPAWCGAALCCLGLGCLSSGLELVCHTLKMVYFPFLGLFDKCLGSPDVKCGIGPGAYGRHMAVLLDTLLASVEFAQAPSYGWSHSADMAVLVTCADILGVSPCQMCLA